MRALLKRIILWALDIKDVTSSAVELDKLSAELKK